jgi:hypothetical protein
MPTTVPGRGERGERGERVGHDDLRQRHGDLALDQRARGALPLRLGHELVAVEALAAQRHEQRAGLERARIRQHGAERCIGAAQHAAGHPCELGEVAVHASSPSAPSTTARSLNGRRSLPTTW